MGNPGALHCIHNEKGVKNDLKKRAVAIEYLTPMRKGVAPPQRALVWFNRWGGTMFKNDKAILCE